MSIKTPILFLIFNRPGITARVFGEIKKIKPARLFIAADGPRDGVDGEREKCEATRQLVLEGVDWPCEVNTLMRAANLGCGKAVSGAINWFFDHVEEGIILEDDCLPDESFFTFCETLLEKYRDERRVMHIGGASFQEKNFGNTDSYYFSNYIHVWGWATWKRAWSIYTFDITDVPGLDNMLKRKFPNAIERDYWVKNFKDMAGHAIDTWDIQWSYSVYKKDGLGITPAVNLISNIGFGPEATHTQTTDTNTTELALGTIRTIKHPSEIVNFRKADNYSFKKLYQFGDTRFNRIKFKIGQKAPLVKAAYHKIFKAGKTSL